MRVLAALLLRRTSVKLDEAGRELKLPAEVVVRIIEDLPVVVESGVLAPIDSAELILRCWEKGIDPVDLALKAGWKDFEKLCSKILERCDFRTLTSVRFKALGAVRELDVVALREPRILAVDCKRWLRRRESSLRAAARSHKARCEAFANSLTSLRELAAEVSKWRGARVIPVIVDIHETSVKIFEGVPIVPIRKLASFVYDLVAFEDEVCSIDIDFRSSPKLDFSG